MRRTVYRRAATGMSLFPFLAVLICTMGALIVLLVMVLQQARVHASADPTPAPAAPAEENSDHRKLREEKEDVDWNREVLEKQRADQTDELTNTRRELSHLEDHIRRLESQWKQIEARVEELRKAGDSRLQDQSALQLELEKIKAEIEIAKQQLDEARKKLSTKPRSFAIIPYQGPHGTKRRPIYIECAEEGIILHPENIVFQPPDFEGPLGPGNPLDSALRTIREYMIANGDVKRDGEPYPLLVVRPNGAVAYSMARAAMRSWDEEFGYELIDDKMSLKFPSPDPALEDLLMRTIKDSRARQASLAAAMPARYKPEGINGFTAGPQGGFSPMLTEDEPVTSLQGGRGFGGSGRSAGGNGAGGMGGGGSGTGGLGSGGSGTGGSGAGGMGPNGDPRNAPNGGVGPQGFAANQGAYGQRGTSSGGGGGGAPQSGPAMQGPMLPGSSGGGAGGSNPYGVSSPGGNSFAANSMGNPSGGDPSTQGTPNPSVTFGSSGSQKSGSSSPSSSSSNQSGQSASSSKESLAKSKGRDWALPNKVAQSTGITRPIRVQVYPDRLMIMPERGDGLRPRTIMLRDGNVRPATEEFVSGVWKHMEHWGLAVAGGYWKPVLRVEVAPGAEQQFADLEALLQGSGLDVQRK